MALTLIPSTSAFILPTAGVTAGQLDQSFVAADIVNGNYFVASGEDILVVQNTGDVSQTFTLFSAPDASGRFANVVYTVAAEGFAAVVINVASLYTMSDGTVQLNASSTTIQFLVMVL